MAQPQAPSLDESNRRPLTRKRLGIVPYLYARPLFAGLREQSSPGAHSLDEFTDGLVESRRPPVKRFECIEDVPSQLAIRLREKQLDGAFLSPIDYAKDYAMYRLLPGIAAISDGESETVLLYFHEHARKFATIGFDPTIPGSDVVLAHLVLKEKYGVVPQFVPLVGSIEAGLRRTDAVLTSGDHTPGLTETPNRLDLVDEWSDITDLPYVHGAWTAREQSLSDEEVRSIIGSAEKESHQESAAENFHFSYELNETAIAALTEFFRMAYYHGILPDVPEVRFVS